MIKECLPKVVIKLLKISYVRILLLVSLLFVAVINCYSVFKPGAHRPSAGAHDWFLEIAFVVDGHGLCKQSAS